MMAGAEDAAETEKPEQATPEQQQQQEEQEERVEETEAEASTDAEQPSGYVAETQTQTQEAQSQSQEENQSQGQRELRADALTDGEEEGEPAQQQPTEELPREQVQAPVFFEEEKQEEQTQPTPVEEEQQEREEEKRPAVEEEPPRFEPPSPPREQQKAPEPEKMSAPPRNSRYSYTELKEAQRRCEGKMVETALLECRDASKAQQEIFRAHVTDLCANIFAAALRKYNPENKEDVEPVDSAISDKVAEMEKRLKAKEAAVEELRKQVPRMAAMTTRLQLASERKRNADVLVTAPEVTDEVEMTDVDVEAMRDAYVKTSTTIANANAKLSQVISQTTETIHVVEQAMKRPKTSIDKAMEHSPLKTTVLLTDQEMASDEHPSSMRTRLAMYLSASKSV